MHAYAAKDPVFLALNRRAQRETKGVVGDFCVRCHAPMAVREKASTDGLNLEGIPEPLKGVTCFFCHSVESVGREQHNNPLVLSDDGAMRAAISDPMPQSARFHKAKTSDLLDQTKDSSVSMCGTCHDIVTPGGGHIERTFKEWKPSSFALESQPKLVCGSCHMLPRSEPAAAVAGAPVRTVHDHSMAAVDLALTSFPQKVAQRAAVQKNLDDAVLARLCVQEASFGTTVTVSLHTDSVGHNWPSGSAQDRRAWVELSADRLGITIFQSGAIPDGEPVSRHLTPDLFLLRDRDFDAAGKETELFWQAASVESIQLPARTTSNPSSPSFDNSLTRTYSVPGPLPDLVRMQVRLLPIDFDLIDDLITSGDLDHSLRSEIHAIALARTRLEWKPSLAERCVQSKGN
ncbi:MAG: hypothetical protein NVSMB1_00310 [Polyangiales bacterium]